MCVKSPSVRDGATFTLLTCQPTSKLRPSPSRLSAIPTKFQFFSKTMRLTWSAPRLSFRNTSIKTLKSSRKSDLFLRRQVESCSDTMMATFCRQAPEFRCTKTSTASTSPPFPPGSWLSPLLIGRSRVPQQSQPTAKWPIAQLAFRGNRTTLWLSTLMKPRLTFRVGSQLTTTVGKSTKTLNWNWLQVT